MTPHTPPSLSVEWAERLSALADGQLSPREIDLTLRAIAQDDAQGQGARDYWRHLHLAGDALRSSDLCSASRPDFAARFLARLAQEPVVLAPSAVAMAVATPSAVASRPADVQAAVDRVAGRSTPGGFWGMGGWRLASGFASVAAVAVLAGFLGFNLGAGDTGSGQMAQGQAPSGGVALASSTAPVVSAVDPVDAAVARMEASANARTDPRTGLAAVPTPGGVVLRDPALDAQIAELMNAHRQFGGAAALGAPSGFARAATADGVPGR